MTRLRPRVILRARPCSTCGMVIRRREHLCRACRDLGIVVRRDPVVVVRHIERATA